MRRLSSTVLALVLFLLAPVARSEGPAAPTPEAFFGYRMGAGERLPDWDQTTAYLHALVRASTRIRLEQLGETTLGRPFLLVTISSPDTLRRLPEARDAQRRLADPRITSEREARQLAREHKAVVLIAGGVHSAETGSAQALVELVWKLATDTTPETQHLLDNAIILVVPSQNPDGLQMTAEWQAANAGTPHEDAPLPELYHPYAGHDNNRDAFMQALVETRHLSRVLYREWLPEVFLDLHQMGPARARVFVPPYRNPANPNVDPLVWSEVNLLGQTMAARLQAAGKSGVVWGETYTGYWQGANSTTPWWHNIVGMLSEVASARPTGELVQDAARAASGSLALPLDRHEGLPHLAAPPDVQYRMTYPDPWLGGRWTPRDVVEHHLLAAWGLLEGVANNRALLKRNFHAMHRRTIERFVAGGPWAFAVPAAQRDRGAADRLLDVLTAGGADVDVVTGAGADGLQTGDAVIRLAQPFGRWIKDLLEPQVYPQPQSASERPYDVTAWTLGLQMGVTVNRLDAPVDVMLTSRGAATSRRGRVRGSGPVLVISREANASATLVNRLLAEGASVAWVTAPTRVGGVDVPAGAALAQGPAATIARAVGDSGLDLTAINDIGQVQTVTARPPRVGIVEPWGGAIDAGWTRLVLEQHGFSFVRLRPTELIDDAAVSHLDAIVIPEMPSLQLLRGQLGPHVRPEHRGGLEDRGVAVLKRFVRRGGTVITLGNAAEFALDYLEVPATVASRADDPESTLVPGTLLRALPELSHPVAAGLPPEIIVMNVMNNAYAPGRGADQIRPILRYPTGALVASGYALGEQRLGGRLAAFEAPVGMGRVVVLGVRVQHRAQTLGTFKLLFNALFMSGAIAAAPETTSFDN